MPRYKLTIEYDGQNFCGWQKQARSVSVQSVIEQALLSFTGGTVQVYGAGRTDSGVHALGQVAHFDLEQERPCFEIRDALNYHLKPHLVAILKVEMVDQGFHARFSAKQRHYVYRISDRRPPLTLSKGQVWRIPQKLDDKIMHIAASELKGMHDFTSFRARECQARSPVKTLDKVDILRVEDEIHCVFSARSFLHKQVRSMVGCLVCVGSGKWSRETLKLALLACDRKACGPVAPPEGLYLTGVDY